MTQYLKLSRTTKALTESLGIDFSEAEKRLESAYIAIVADDYTKKTVAGQAALLTALATAKKTFTQVALVISEDVELQQSLPNANTLCIAAEMFGAHVLAEVPSATTHSVIMNSLIPSAGFIVRCWWGRWCSGVLPSWDARTLGESWNPLAGSYSGALAIREIFANVLGRRDNPRESIISLWEPWQKIEDADEGPTTVYVPKNMWLVGLGHLGQGFLWNLGMLSVHGEKIILQDYQRAGVENEATGLLTNSSSIGKHKTRVASEWIEKLGWSTELIERKFTDKTEVTVDDPPFVIAGLDSIKPRIDILKAGFDYMIDAGVGHGPFDFELTQIRVLAKGSASNWNKLSKPKDVGKLLATEAYKKIDACGAFALAEASVAVPFVGAALGALSLTQAMRLTAMLGASTLIQIELSAPDFNSSAIISAAPTSNLGGVPLDFLAIETNNSGEKND
jgi:hypothetical protein